MARTGSAWTRGGAGPAHDLDVVLPLAGQLGVVLDDDNVYWSYGSGGWIQRCPHAGCTQANEFVSGQKPTFLAVDTTNLYWISTDIADSGGGTAGTGKIVSRRRSP